MTDKLRDQCDSTVLARRRLIKSLAAGGGIAASLNAPRDWTRPVVDSVLLPAHAQTSVVDDATVTFAVACQTASGPTGSPTPPGIDIDFFPPTIVNPQVVITPTPGAGATVLVQPFRDGVLLPAFVANQDVSTGISAPFNFSAGALGVLEVRYTFAGQTCSLYWNCVDIP